MVLKPFNRPDTSKPQNRFPGEEFATFSWAPVPLYSSQGYTAAFNFLSLLPSVPVAIHFGFYRSVRRKKWDKNISALISHIWGIFTSPS
ncbi:hypothetical protein CDAR_267381 [Caerostris darwini]|uniref:Uncharacterized protein n=1 Tax=Caerostris darwini TaxID=1538125 RepID=A0AAV4THS8_9ARAC|nr:hypothetical protein CDAR_267381 [Caerostris darwini]